MTSLDGSGLGIMEISHRSKLFARVLETAKSGLRDLLAIPADYKILFLQGGATLQFSMIPMNLLPPGGTTDHIVTGTWGMKAAKEASRFGTVKVIYDGMPEGFGSVPTQDDLRFDPDASYIHYTSNETIDGVEFKYDLDGHGIPV